MINTLVHRVETLDWQSVETVKQMQDVLSRLQGSGGDDRYLDTTYCVDLLCETLSDGSEVLKIRVFPAERQA